MNSSSHPQLAVVPAPPGRKAQGASGGSWRPAAVALGVALLAALGWLSTGASRASAVRELPPAQRAAVAARALANLRDVCTAGERPREFCKEQALLLVELTECAEECQTLAREVLRADLAVR